MNIKIQKEIWKSYPAGEYKFSASSLVRARSEANNIDTIFFTQYD